MFTIAFAASLLQVGSFVVLTFIPDTSPKWVICSAFLLYGVSNALFLTSYWPCIKLVVPSGLTATAYGLNFCLQAVLMMSGPLLTGYVIDKTKENSGGYYGSSLVFLLVSVVSAVIGLIVLVKDLKGERALYDKIPKAEGMELEP